MTSRFSLRKEILLNLPENDFQILKLTDVFYKTFNCFYRTSNIVYNVWNSATQPIMHIKLPLQFKFSLRLGRKVRSTENRVIGF